MNYKHISPVQAADFHALRKASKHPVFKINAYGEIISNCKVIQEARTAVFIHVQGFLWSGGFWMPRGTHMTLKNGYIYGPQNLQCVGPEINLNNTLYQY